MGMLVHSVRPVNLCADVGTIDINSQMVETSPLPPIAQK